MTRYTIDTTPSRPATVAGGAARRPKWLYGAVALAAAVVVVAAFVALRPKRVPPPTADKKELVKFVASAEFAAMPTERKKPYLEALGTNPREFFEAVRNSGLPDEQRGQLMENFFMSRMQEQVDAYFALPLGRQRVAYLDKLIDESEKRREEWAARRATQPARPEGERMARGPEGPRQDGPPPGGGDGAGRRGRGNTAERMKNRMENIPPEFRARWAEFRKALSDRRKERGLPESPRRPGPRTSVMALAQAGG